MKKFKIEKIGCSNFLGLKSCMFSPQKEVILLSAPFGSGKTSMLKMFAFALTGEIPGMVYAKETLEDGYVVCTLCTEETTLNIKRVLKAKGGQDLYLDGKKTTKKAGNEYICNILGCSAESLKAQTDIYSVPTLNKKELTNLFVKNLPISFENKDKYIEVAKVYDPDIPEEDIEMIKGFLPNEKFGILDIESAYKEAYEYRRKLNKELKNVEGTITSLNALIPNDEILESKEEMKKKLEEAIIELSKAEEIEKKKIEFKKLYNDFLERKKQREKAVEYKAKLEETIKKAKKDYKPVNKEAVENNKKLIDSNQKQLNLIEESIVKVNYSINNRKSDLKNFEDPKACPYNKFLNGTEHIICKTDKSSAVLGIKKELEDNLKHLETLKQAKEEATKILEAALNTDKQYELSSKKEFEISLMEKQLKEIIIPEIGVEPKLEELKSSKEETLKKKTDLIRKIEILEKREEIEKYIKQRDILYKKISILNRTVDLFSPSGLNSFVLNKAIGIFENDINSQISKINPNFEIKFEINEGFEMLYRSKKDMTFISLDNASSGEKTLVAYSLGILLIGINDTGLLLIDNIDNLDIESQERFINLISEKEELSLSVVVTNDKLENIVETEKIMVIGNK